MWHDLLVGTTRALSYVAISCGVMLIGYFVRDVMTPGKLGRLGTRMVQDRDVNAVLLTTSQFAASGIILATSILTRSGSFGRAAVDTAVYGLFGVVILVVATAFIDLCTPGKLSDILHEDRFHPLSAVVATTQIVVGVVVACSIAAIA